MPMLKEPGKKYKPLPPPHLPNRVWPTRTLTKPPRWLDSSCRDGNQANVNPMNGDEKMRFVKMLCDIGFKEIEISFPSASATEYSFTRGLIEGGTLPDDVWIQVLSPCREELIRRTVESVKGAKNAIIHIYLATSECFRRVVFDFSEDDSVELAVRCTKLVRSLTKDDPSQAGTNWQFQFSPETFSETSPEFIVRICEAVKEAWEPSVDNKIIMNLPSTTEVSYPNVFADQVEYFCTNITEREKVCVSLCHNDRGTGIAAAELGQMAGADRVEGCVLGNGERCGNVDLMILAMNMYTQGIHPGLDFSDLNHVIEVVETCNKIPVHPRTPYAGSLVVCAFSGSHQDAIKKGFQRREAEGKTREDHWQMPYLPLDPEDIGRNYEAIIRVNSQSGKGGAAYIILKKLHLDLPRGLQVAFSHIVQRQADNLGRELLADEITELFEKTFYLQRNPRFTIVDYSITPDRSQSPAPPAPGKTQDIRNMKRVFEGVVAVDGREHRLRGRGNGPISSLADALKQVGVEIDVVDYKEHAIGEGRDVKAATYIECVANEQKFWGVGIHEDVVQSSLIALLGAASTFVASRPTSPIIPRPTALRPLDKDHDLSAGANGAAKGTDAAASGVPTVVSILEEKANDM